MSTLLFYLFNVFLLVRLAESSPVHGRQTNCTDPVVRKEWGAATDAEKSSYINAVLCLAKKPSRLGLSTTLYDDFGYIHNKLTLQSTIDSSNSDSELRQHIRSLTLCSSWGSSFPSMAPLLRPYLRVRTTRMWLYR